jgi:hypothetical protein
MKPRIKIYLMASLRIIDDEEKRVHRFYQICLLQKVTDIDIFRSQYEKSPGCPGLFA